MLAMSDREKGCIRSFANLFERGEASQSIPYGPFLLNGEWLEPHEVVSLLGMMEHAYGVIGDVKCLRDHSWMFSITATAVLLARDINADEKLAKEPGDIVGQVHESTRKHPWIAFLIIAFFVLTALVTLVNQTIQLLQNLGAGAKP